MVRLTERQLENIGFNAAVLGRGQLTERMPFFPVSSLTASACSSPAIRRCLKAGSPSRSGGPAPSHRPRISWKATVYSIAPKQVRWPGRASAPRNCWR